MSPVSVGLALRQLREAAAERNPALRVFLDRDDRNTIVVAVVDPAGAGRVLRRLDAPGAQALALELKAGRGLLATVA